MLARAKELEGRRPAFSLLDGLRFFRAHLGTAAVMAVMAALLLVALGSTNALPGDGLYPIKLAAEEAGILMGSSDPMRLEREAGLETRRAETVLGMIRKKQTGAVQFGGFLNRSPLEGWQAAGISLGLSQEMEQQAGSLAGVYVEIEGSLNPQGRVQVTMLEPRVFTLRGAVRAINANNWLVGSQAVRLTANTQIEGAPSLGSDVTVDAARVAGSEEMLALRIQKAAALPEASPKASATPSPSSTHTPAATPSMTTTATPTPTITQLPVVLPTVQETDDHGGDDSPEKEESEEDHSGSSEDGGEQKEDSSGKSGEGESGDD
jgi:hypothetical protein